MTESDIITADGTRLVLKAVLREPSKLTTEQIRAWEKAHLNKDADHTSRDAEDGSWEYWERVRQ